jgi:hypothetical protein
MRFVGEAEVGAACLGDVVLWHNYGNRQGGRRGVKRTNTCAHTHLWH